MLNIKRKLIPTVLAYAASIGLGVTSNIVLADNDFYTALTDGKVSFSSRARYESVSDDNPSRKDAEAYTIRTSLDYETGAFEGFKGFLELENVIALGNEKYDFNSGPQGKNQYSVIADPEGTEVNQAYLQYNGFDTQFRLGRQELMYRETPWHRFIGNLFWRQHHQSFDAFTLKNTSLADTQISYAYINKVNSVLGDDADNAVLGVEDGSEDMNSHLFNIQYTAVPLGKLESYGYFLEYDSGLYKTKSNKTLGVRFSGSQPVNDDLNVVYAMEYANQDQYKSGTMDDQNYYMAELGDEYKGWLTKVSYELQEGDGTSSFKTLLGANHAYQGWADIFLSTPAVGLRDTYFTLSGKVVGLKVIAVYHDFETDKSSLDAGDEIDVLLQKTFNKHYLVGVKYADYHSGDKKLATVDTEKLWVYGQVQY
ncbi:alginate export family protein [Methylophaga sulfidovorans]|uniref:Alginate export n=1 Tax=Methylophaga sulfidovorans TaxID=45496 RepID=A0A1I3ZE20_9GAMM|nr:alginate export family protein [Methylophaga sulfidovorans]SFK42233.1 Alginate export [Methylophaga sulfidovorans]